MVAGLTGKIVAAIDLALEPVLTGPVGFWRWQDPHPWLAAPWTNGLWWFVVGCLGALALRAAGVAVLSVGPARRFLVLVVVCTLVIGVTHGEWRALWAVPVLAFVLFLNPRSSQSQALDRRTGSVG
jgi:hypothetical protein